MFSRHSTCAVPILECQSGVSVVLIGMRDRQQQAYGLVVESWMWRSWQGMDVFVNPVLTVCVNGSPDCVCVLSGSFLCVTGKVTGCTAWVSGSLTQCVSSACIRESGKCIKCGYKNDTK